jgi:uncharacterized membrane protein YccC
VLKNVGFREIIFSVNCFIAVMLALFIAFRLSFANPWWAMVTVYLTSQPLSGALRAKAVYRVLGTLIGGVAMLVIVPNLADAPELTTAAITIWVALCVYASVLDRSPRAYTLALAGFTAALVGFPSVLNPGAVFDTAIARMEEIVLGTMCAALVHSLIVPRSVFTALITKQSAVLADARRWISEGLARGATPALEREQRRIAADATELAILGMTLPYDTASQRPSRNLVRALDERLVALLPLLATIEDRIALLRQNGALPDKMAKLLDDVSRWCAQKETGDRTQAYDLRRACIAVMPNTGPHSGWTDILTVSLVARLGELIGSWQDCLELATLMREQSVVHDQHLRALIARREAKPLHRDHGIAVLSALTVTIAMLICSVFWIATAWPSGAVAVGFVAVICSLFAALDDPSPVMFTLTIGIVISIPLAALYQFGILPAIDGYAALVVCLAPAFIPIGIAMAIPKYSLLGLALALGLTVQLALQPSYQADMATFLNSSIAVVLGGAVGVAVTRVMRAIGAQTAARRLVRAGWRDLADIAERNITPTRAEWASRMLDRAGLLLPRLSHAAPGDVELQTADALRDLRTGINVINLQQIVAGLSAHGSALAAHVLAGVATHFRDLARGRQPMLEPALLGGIDALINAMLAMRPGSRQHRGLAAVVGLRRNLYPDAQPYRGPPLPVEAIA